MRSHSGAPLLRQTPSKTLYHLLMACLFCAVPTIGVALAIASIADRSPAVAVLTQAIVSISVALVTYRLFVSRLEGRPLLELAGTGAVGEVGAGVAIGAALFALTVVVLSLAGAFSLVGFGKLSSLPFALMAAIAAAFTEEILFRGLLFRLLEKTFGSYVALLASSALFGVFHLLSPNATALGVAAIFLEAGLLLGVAFMVTRRLWLPIGVHFGWNFVQGGVFGTAVSGNPSTGLFQGRLTGPEWLSGGAFGAEASVVAIGLCLLVTLVLMQIARKERKVAPFRPAGDSAVAVAGHHG